VANFFESADISQSKKKVLNSALTLFVEKGFFNTSIPDLVRHSGVSTGSIYHAFKDKETLAEELMGLLLDRIEMDQMLILSEYTSPKDQYYQLVKWKFQMAIDYPHFQQFVLYARHREFLPDLLPVCTAKPFMVMRGVVEKAQQVGLLREMDLQAASAIMYGGALQLMKLHLEGVLKTDLMQHLDSVTEAAWSALEA